jgi:hypothetical protein
MTTTPQTYLALARAVDLSEFWEKAVRGLLDRICAVG